MREWFSPPLSYSDGCPVGRVYFLFMSATSAVASGQPPMATGRLRNTKRFVTDPITFLSDSMTQHGDVFRFQLITGDMVGITHPHHIKYILQERMANFTRETQMYDIIEPFMGRGLATIADHSRWRRSRRLVQPAFHHKRIDALSEIMVAEIESMCDEWAEHAHAGRRIDIGVQMSHLTLRIVVRALFGLDPHGPEVTGFSRATQKVNAELGKFVRMPLIPLKFPTPSHRRFWRAIAEMDAIVYTVIDKLRDTDNDGLLSMLMNARDVDTDDSLTDGELRDEVVTMLFAGHETSASALTSAMLLLQLHPEVRRQLRDQVDAALPGRHATMSDLPALPYSKQVLEEVLRLRPPGWMGQRRAAEDDEIGGYHIPAGTPLMFSYYHAHRNPECWDQPDTFDPDRFTADAIAARDRNVYLPFGAGGHLCIGNEFAMMEMRLALATIMRRFEFAIENPDLTTTSALTLNTKFPVIATLTERTT
ncbi:cytochrome P450 [Nocardia abscessus]|uniref:Cytochrome P450 n=2 Tax=Nocardia abscessus TaxID=120957 RepID=A0ABS0C6G3_9NOCA|nr:cytochrome P450 [Nocardia abscessus]MBF6225182.1 cytochrome P450 [Nocardia abscessus]